MRNAFKGLLLAAALSAGPSAALAAEGAACCEAVACEAAMERFFDLIGYFEDAHALMGYRMEILACEASPDFVFVYYSPPGMAEEFLDAAVLYAADAGFSIGLGELSPALAEFEGRDWLLDERLSRSLAPVPQGGSRLRIRAGGDDSYFAFDFALWDAGGALVRQVRLGIVL